MMRKRSEKQKRKSKAEDKRRAERSKENTREVSLEEDPAEFDRVLAKMLIMDRSHRALRRDLRLAAKYKVGVSDKGQ
jgi:hypothetical protein